MTAVATADVPAAPVAPVKPLKVLHALLEVPPDLCGALVRKHADGAIAGALLVERGRLCWAMSEGHSRRLADAMVAESPTLTAAQITELVVVCRRERMPLGETLIARGIVSLPTLRRVLVRHTCEALHALLHVDASPWKWVAHSGYGYHPMLTFSPAEILAGVRALAEPALAAHADATLRRTLGIAQRGLAFHRRHDPRLPIAQIGCDDLDLGALVDLAVQAEQVMAVAATMAIDVVVAELGELAGATWVEGDLMFLLLCEGELAFNRLLAQVAARTQPEEEDCRWRTQGTH